ncbi:hydantoinase/oxoprolinase family protein [Streptomyces hainanensis]|uniref:Hydantoinase/oxoprolinase family protein n=1 Tax=Streptomyces hainanensis TaxID=402648 RepID=A0A4R4TKE9_9ACTN|nr:hydantoinase/oxoprolinase family protein [Streptomyces hainanensis]TDC74569.1 hydantoinase/oxoprolinase family protein [Streptomyces hainanensis]
MTSTQAARPRIGVDVGGTFTDVVLTTADGAVHPAKVPSDAARPAAAVVRAVTEVLRRHDIAAEDVEYFAHGQTFALNTVLQRAGARTGLLVTAGFPDLLDIGRLRLRDPIDFFAAPAHPLADRRDVREIPERVRADGTVELPLDERALLDAVADLRASGVTALAVCFLHAHAHPAHERRAVELVRAAHPDLVVAGSAELWPEEKEFERATVAVLAAHVAGLLGGYLADLTERLRAAGLRCPVHITKSNGGVMSVTGGAHRGNESDADGRAPLRAAVETLLSGPAAGVAGAVRLAAAAGVDRLITMDMGGTSVDCTIVDGAVPYSTDSALGDFPLLIPAIEIDSIGAGGGSVAHLDASGVLKVGPRSAGAQPGPACYGRGGTEPTLTDAYVVCGHLAPEAPENSESFADGAVTIDPEAARAAFRPLADRLGLDVRQAAAATIDVATAMTHARLLPLLARRGVDPGATHLVAYGGAGPVQAVALARALAVPRVLVPWSPGTLCAFGALVSGLRQDLVTSVGETTATLDDTRLETAWKDLTERALAWYAEQDATLHTTVTTRRWADVQRAGQSFTLPVVLPDDAPATVAELRRGFAAAYHAAYGVDASAAELDVRNLRLTLTADAASPPLPSATATGGAAPRPHRLYENGAEVAAVKVARADLPAGATLAGPAVIAAPDTTVYVPGGAVARVDPAGNLLIDTGVARGEAG